MSFMEKEKKANNIINHFEKDSNCQIFNGSISGCVFAMPGSQVKQQSTASPSDADEAKEQDLPADNSHKREGMPTFFVHPSVDANQEWQIHDELARLVARQGIQEICKYLTQLSDDKKVMLPQNAERAYNELVRLGMPDGEGYSLKTFTKYYKR
jgi:hypothetical protein